MFCQAKVTIWPEDADQMSDLRAFTRELMVEAEGAHGTHGDRLTDHVLGRLVERGLHDELGGSACASTAKGLALY